MKYLDFFNGKKTAIGGIALMAVDILVMLGMSGRIIDVLTYVGMTMVTVGVGHKVKKSKMSS